jgi:hypothetical protein
MEKPKKLTMKLLLPADYPLGPNDVLCGRGLHCYEHIGNERLRMIVDRYLPDYIAAKKKREKSSILERVIDEVCSDAYKSNKSSGCRSGRFVKYDPTTERYHEVNDVYVVSHGLYWTDIAIKRCRK